MSLTLLANAYRRSAVQGTEKKGVVKELYIAPDARVKEYYENTIGKDFKKAEELQKEGYDAIYAYRADGNLEEVVVMNPNILYDSADLKKVWEAKDKLKTRSQLKAEWDAVQ